MTSGLDNTSNNRASAEDKTSIPTPQNLTFFRQPTPEYIIAGTLKSQAAAYTVKHFAENRLVYKG